MHWGHYKTWPHVRASERNLLFTKAEGNAGVTAWLPSAWSVDETLQVFLVQRWNRTFLKCYRKCISLIFWCNKIVGASHAHVFENTSPLGAYVENVSFSSACLERIASYLANTSTRCSTSAQGLKCRELCI